MLSRCAFALLFATTCHVLAAAPAAPAPAKSAVVPATPKTPAPKKVEFSVVRVSSTNQAPDFLRPWGKKGPSGRRGLGAVLSKGRVLVTAELVQNCNYIELEKAESGERMSATVVCIDYEANLALVQPTEPKFLAGLKPMELTMDAKVGDKLDILQLESNDALAMTSGPITTIEVARYQIDDASFLLYRLNVSLQFKESSFTAPVLKDGKLAGMLLRFAPQNQTADVIPAPVITHFLKDLDDGNYQGFPRAGFLFAPTRDPQLRRYAKMPMGNGGIFITEVAEGSPAAKAGLQPGDVLLAVGDINVDQDGNYEEPLYGRITLSHYLSVRHQVGDKLAFKILRDGKPQTIELTLARKDLKEYGVMPYLFDRSPRYYILGGLILQELTRQHLKEWGNDWKKAAPPRLVMYDQMQSQLLKGDRKHVVFLSQVLPTATTVGYNELNFLVVSAINGVKINSLDDVPKAVAASTNGFHKIEFEDHPKEIYLDAEQTAAVDELVQKTYRLPSLKQLE
jgi:S1-C subfamily serine protease